MRARCAQSLSCVRARARARAFPLANLLTVSLSILPQARLRATTSTHFKTMLNPQNRSMLRKIEKHKADQKLQAKQLAQRRDEAAAKLQRMQRARVARELRWVACFACRLHSAVVIQSYARSTLCRLRIWWWWQKWLGRWRRRSSGGGRKGKKPFTQKQKLNGKRVGASPSEPH